MNSSTFRSDSIKFIHFYNEFWMLLEHQFYAGSGSYRKTSVFTMNLLTFRQILIICWSFSIKLYRFLQWILNAARTPVLCGLRTSSRNLSFYNEFVHFLIKFDQIHSFLQWIMKAAQTSLFCGLRTPPRLGGAIWEELGWAGPGWASPLAQTSPD